MTWGLMMRVKTHKLERAWGEGQEDRTGPLVLEIEVDVELQLKKKGRKRKKPGSSHSWSMGG